MNKKHIFVISLSVGATICILIFSVIMSALTGGSKYSTTDECFFSRSFSDLDYSYDMPNRKHIPMRKIVELPMGERKTLYLGYSCDSIEKDDEFVEYIIMRKENDLFKLQEWGTRKA